MLTGTVTKLVKSFGSTWGRVRPARRTADRGSRHVFFNVASLIDASDFARLSEGSAVQFNVRRDRANGVSALRMRILGASSSPPTAPRATKVRA